MSGVLRGQFTFVPMDAEKIVIAYGSSRGGAEKIAKTIATGMGLTAVALNELDRRKLLTAQFAVFVISTTGNGQYPANCQAFCQEFEGCSMDLSHLRFALLALGSTYYKLFCRAGDNLLRMLQNRGAQPLIPYMRSNKASSDYGEGAITEFTTELSKALIKSCNEKESLFEMKEIAKEDVDAPPRGYTFTRILAKQLLSAPEYRPALRRYKLEIPEGVKYEAGWHVRVVPENPEKITRDVIKKFDLNPDTVLQVTDPTGTALVPEKVTIYQLFKRFVDLNCKVTRRLLDTCGKKNTKAPTVGQFLISEYDKPFENVCDLVNMLPLIEPRTFSVASEKEDCAELVIVDRWIGELQGLATGYLSCDETTRVAVSFVEGAFSYPVVPDTSMLITALGSGIAPVMSILEHRKKEIAGKCFVFYGLRHRDSSPVIIEELEQYKKDGVIDELFLCVSREGRRQHVDVALKENAAKVWEIWENMATELFYCGPPDGYDNVREALVHLATLAGNNTRTNALYICSRHKLNVEAY